jgi:hypothetical protein
LFYDYSWNFFSLQPIAEGNCDIYPCKGGLISEGFFHFGSNLPKNVPNHYATVELGNKELFGRPKIVP